MADIEAGNLGSPKAEPVGKPDDRRIARRGKQGPHAPRGRPFRVPVGLALHALRFQAKGGNAVPPCVCNKRVQGAPGSD